PRVKTLYAQWDVVGGEPIDEDVVFDATIFVADHGILGLRNGEFADIVGGDSLEERDSTSSGDSHPPHMAHIEEPDMGTDGMVLVHDSAVLDGHLPSGEIDEFGPAGLMVCDEWRALHDVAHRPRSSTSKINVACGGIKPPAPCAP